MELIPIIKLALVIFSTVVFFIILISYMIYKAKEKMNDHSKSQKGNSENVRNGHRVHAKNENTFLRDNYTNHANREQLYFVPGKEVRKIPVLVESQSRARARFKIVNNQPLNFKIYETRAENPRAFYHPNPQMANSYSFRAGNGNILDSYSLSDEPLQKLALK